MKLIISTSTSAVIALLSLTLALQSCSKIAKNFNYDLSMQTASVNVTLYPEKDTKAFHTFGSGTDTYNIDSFIRANTMGMLGINNITSIKLQACVFTLQNANQANNFANLESCSASFISGDVAPYNLSISNNPDVYATSISLPVDTSVQMKQYLNGNTFNYSLGGQLRKATTDTLQCTIQITYNVNVQG